MGGIEGMFGDNGPMQQFMGMTPEMLKQMQDAAKMEAEIEKMAVRKPLSCGKCGMKYFVQHVLVEATVKEYVGVLLPPGTPPGANKTLECKPLKLILVCPQCKSIVATEQLGVSRDKREKEVQDSRRATKDDIGRKTAQKDTGIIGKKQGSVCDSKSIRNSDGQVNKGSKASQEKD